jgi:biotin transport system substrate-specific component
MIIKFLISCAILYACGPVVITNIEQMPITLQSLAILFVAIGFGWRIGTTATVVYVFAGAMGIPVFAGYKGGVQALGGIYAGFFFGFIAAALISGYLSELKAFSKTLPSILNWFIGHTIILIFGAIWMIMLGLPDWQTKIQSVLTGAIIKSLLGAVIIDIMIRLMTKRNNKRAFVD